MTNAFTDALEAKVSEVAALQDTLDRYHAARNARAASMRVLDQPLQEIQREAVRTLRTGRTWAEVGELIGASGSWAEALATGRSSKRRKVDHAAKPTPRAGAEEGHAADTEEPETT